MKSILPGSTGLGAPYTHPCLGVLSARGTLGAKPLRGDGEERGGAAEGLPVPCGTAGLLQPLLASSSDPDFVPAPYTCVGWTRILWVAPARPRDTQGGERCPQPQRRLAWPLAMEERGKSPPSPQVPHPHRLLGLRHGERAGRG